MQMIQEGIYANAPEKPLKMIGSPQAILKAKVNHLDHLTYHIWLSQHNLFFIFILI